MPTIDRTLPRRAGRALLPILACTAACAVPAPEAGVTRGSTLRGDDPPSALSGSATFRGDDAHTGVYASSSPEGLLEVVWRSQTDGPVRSSPAVVGGTVYFGSGDGALHALDRATGATRWRFATGGAVHSSPAVTGGTVYFTSRDRCVYALDAASGALRWRTETGAELSFRWGWDYFLSSPAVVAGTVYVGAGDGNVYALDAASGETRWTFATGGRVRSSPAVVDGRVHVGSMDGRMYAIDADDGALVWKHDTLGAAIDSGAVGFDRTSVQSSPALSAGHVVFGSRDGNLYAVDRASGETRWRFDHVISWVNGSPALFEGCALVGSSDGRFFHSVDVATGAERWRYATGFNVFGSAAVAEGRAFFGAQDGWIHVLDARTGTPVTRFRAGGAINSSPVVADGVVYCGSDDGALYALCAARPAQAHRAVFWNETDAPRWFRGDVLARDHFEAAGYEVLDSFSLPSFLRERASDREPSVVVFASDALPEAAGAHENGVAPLRRYLDNGGKVVWLGLPPLLIEFDSRTREPSRMTPARASALLGIDYAGLRMDELGAWPSPDGERWGLRGWSMSAGSIERAQVTTVLALDEEDQPVAWVKSYGGKEGTGFVRLWGRREPCPDLDSVRAVAEFGLE